MAGVFLLGGWGYADLGDFGDGGDKGGVEVAGGVAGVVVAGGSSHLGGMVYEAPLLETVLGMMAMLKRCLCFISSVTFWLYDLMRLLK